MSLPSLPSAPEAEVSLLGTMILYDSATKTAMEEGLSADDFFVENNRLIFLAIKSLSDEGAPVDPTAVSTRLKDRGDFDKVGGNTALTDLMQSAVTSANTRMYVSILKDKAITRKMIEAGRKISSDGFISFIW